MKKLIYGTVFFVLLGLVKSADAQVNVSINIGSQPSWGPSGYDYARYYYMPELDVYYDVSNRSYIYLQGNVWSSHRSLPHRHRGADMYRVRKVVINDSYPWKRHKHYRSNYAYHKPHRSKNNHYSHKRNDRHEYHSRSHNSKHYKKGHQKKHKSSKKHQHRR